MHRHQHLLPHGSLLLPNRLLLYSCLLKSLFLPGNVHLAARFPEVLLPDAQSPDTVLPQSFPIPDAFDRLLPDGRINSGTSAFHPTDKAVCSLLLIVAVLYFASFGC